MKAKIVLPIAISILLFSLVSGTRFVEKGVEVTNAVNSGQGFPSGLGESSVDWWPMFHHDLNRTGYSTSKAPKTNNTLWSSAVGSEASRVYSPVVADGRVYLNSQNNGRYLNCLNASTGELIWSAETWSPTCPAVTNGRVYSGSYLSGSFYCFNASTGEQIWTAHNMSEDFFFEISSPAVFDDKVYAGSNNYGNLYCFNASTGEQIWTFRGFGGYFSSPAIVDGRVYAKRSGTTYCLDASTGEQIWSYFHWANSYSSIAVATGRVYVPVGDKFDCLNASTGELLWEYGVGDFYSSPAVADGRVYVGLGESSVYCLNASTGQKLWKYTTGGLIGTSSPAVAGARVYITSTDGKLYCLNALTGDFIWAYKLGTIYAYSPSPAVANGKLYSGSGDGKAYCFGGHDVAVVDVSPSSTEAYAGDTISVLVTVRNEGTFNETFSVSAYYDSTLIGTQTVVNLTQDASNVLTFSWETTGLLGGYYTLSANASIVPDETNTTNNIFTNGVVKITSPVRIKEVFPCNQTGGVKSTFQRGTLAFFKVTVNSTSLIPQSTLITVNLYDNASLAIGVGSIQGPLFPGTSTYILGVNIATTATIGTATVYANCYTDWPSQGGFPHCPEKSATLEITGP